MAVNVPASALAWVVSTFVITKNVKEHFAIFGASGALVFSLLTWLVLTFLLQRNERETRAS
jgi:hypothetical protein